MVSNDVQKMRKLKEREKEIITKKKNSDFNIQTLTSISLFLTLREHVCFGILMVIFFHNLPNSEIQDNGLRLCSHLVPEH